MPPNQRDYDYGSLGDREDVSDRRKREIGRLRSSPTFRLGTLFTRAAERPWRLLWLPLSVLLLLIRVTRERLGYLPRFSDSESFENTINKRDCIVFFPTNGVGFGHFTRMLAVARRMKKSDPKLEIVFFTTMPALHILQDEGFPAYHLPNRKKFTNMDPSTWNAITEEMLANVFAIHRPKAFVFDGTYPYRGMLNAIKRRKDIIRIWMRRGTFKRGASNVPVDSFSHFDLIVRPSDSVAEEGDEEEGMPPIIHCDPILLVDPDESLPSNFLRSRLGIPSEVTLVYVQLGAGRINDIFSDVWITTQALSEAGAFVVLGESMLGERLDFEEFEEFDNLRVLRDYPNSRYFRSFDFAVMAGGYNSYHEALSFALPCICIPNAGTGVDDQLKRVKVADNAGAMLVIENLTRPKMLAALEKMMDVDARNEMSLACEDLQRSNGTLQVANHIIEMMRKIQ